MRIFVALMLLLVTHTAIAQRDFTATVDSERTDVWVDVGDPGWTLAIAPSGRVSSALLADFDIAGTPRWWFGGAARSGPGQVSMQLLRARWDVSGNRLAGAVAAGTLQFTRIDEDHASIVMTLEGRQRQHQLTRYVVNRDYSLGDRSGFWFDPQDGGHGQMLIQQGDWLGSISLGYDRDGEPTWAFAQGSIHTGNLQSTRVSRPCDPTCRNVLAAGGGVRLLFPGQDDAIAAIGMSDPIGEFWTRANTALTRYTQAPNNRAHAAALAKFGSDAAMARYFVKAPAENPYYGLDGCIDFSPGLPDASMQVASSTNLQEIGVDEHDESKRLGDLVYSLRPQTYDNLPVAAAIRVHAMSADSSVMALQYVVPIQTSAGAELLGLHLLNSGGAAKLLVIAATNPYYTGFSDGCGYESVAGMTWAILYDLRADGMPIERHRLQIDGNFSASRRIGSVLYLATSAVLADSVGGVPTYPQWRVDGGAPQSMVNRDNTWLPNFAPNALERTLTTITRLDLGAPTTPQFTSVFARVDTSYVSPTAWYLASTQYRINANVPLALLPDGRVLDIHKLGLAALDYRGTGSVSGSIFSSSDDSFRFSEQGEYLRVMTDNAGWWQTGSLFKLSVLKEDAPAKRLNIVAQLPNAQRPQAIGPAHEQPYGVRFSGDVVYAVSFFRIDPLYAIDLSNPLDPKLDSALEISGYSSYLHPLPGGFVLGFGQDAVQGTNGDAPGFAWFQGLKFSLFDQRDRAHPIESWREIVGMRGSMSPLLADHRAIATADLGNGWQRIAIPVEIAAGTPSAEEPWMHQPWQQTGVALLEVSQTGAVRNFAVRAARHVSNGQSPLGHELGRTRAALYGDNVYLLVAGQWYVTSINQTGAMSGPY